MKFGENEAGEALPFEVPMHDLMVLRVPGREAQTVFTIERNLFNYKVCEYIEPLFYDRQWCYPTLQEAITALAGYLTDPGQVEPGGWVRAISMSEGTLRRAGELVNG